MPGAQYAFRVLHPDSPVLRVRYRSGILVDPYGYPDWSLTARAVLELPAPPPGLTRDEIRVLDVLTANLALVRWDEDPLWSAAAGTPRGWCWAHLGRSRRLALVPVELHGCYRHTGGLRSLDVPMRPGGVRGPFDQAPVPFEPAEDVQETGLDAVEEALGTPLPPSYREFLSATNGAAPQVPGVLPGFGFVVDQPFFGRARVDLHQDVTYAWQWFVDRFTPDLLPIGYVQGGLLALRLAGPDADSVWYWDDDDPRDQADFGPEHIRDHLLTRCSGSLAEFLAGLRRPPAWLAELAGQLVDDGAVREVRDELTGVGLAASRRAAWQRPPEGSNDPVTDSFDLS
jgi:hypothetical protein